MKLPQAPHKGGQSAEVCLGGIEAIVVEHCALTGNHLQRTPPAHSLCFDLDAKMMRRNMQEGFAWKRAWSASG